MGVSGFYIALIHPFLWILGGLDSIGCCLQKYFLRQCYTLFLPCMLC